MEESNNITIDIGKSILLTENYIYTKIINLNLKKIKDSSDIMNSLIKRKFLNSNVDYSDISKLITTSLFAQYNLLLYPLNGFHELYFEIRKLFYDILEYNNMQNNGTKYYIQCWLNYYKKGEFIDWHKHWPPENKTWHGFYCLDTDDSYTSYKIPNNSKIINIKSENNKIIISKSDGDTHKSSEWKKYNPRITIAFDIVPFEYINHEDTINHWMPI